MLSDVFGFSKSRLTVITLTFCHLKMKWSSLVVQWLQLHAPNAQGLGFIPDEGTRSHMLQLRPSTVEKKECVYIYIYIAKCCLL